MIRFPILCSYFILFIYKYLSTRTYNSIFNMAYFWEQFTADELNKIENFKMNLNQIEDNKFISLFDRPNLYTIADKSSINLRESKDGILLQACWVLYLNKLKATLPSQDLKYKSLSQFLGEYPEFIHKNAQEQINLFHTANWMVELFKMIPAYKNKGKYTIMLNS